MRGCILCFLLLLGVTIAGAQQHEELRKSIYFGGGSYEIDDDQMDMLSDWLDSIPNLLDKYQIQLISHTDPVGGREFNEWLSKMRSESVHQILLQKDIPEQFITIKDWGFDNPVYSNRNFRGMLMNRRVDVILYPLVY
jgi:outer membrane protein OmpA-like peptidoglycan-associated protein